MSFGGSRCGGLSCTCGLRAEQVHISLENEGDPDYDSRKEFRDPCREEWAETLSFIFKDSCSRESGSKINAEALPRLILTYIFSVHTHNGSIEMMS